ncbi:RNA polymerase sigma factor [Shimia abyssi]|uniref:RNA polymerase sigma-70 factor (ECF subfamily) n=1 Tax=Shimia abyssi TaxID=1662395 RepID=A0A2P8F7A1_9RHOB|nr:RNA polymerase sigma factor [Shimia abyssi]PSL17577.1 RNA polymerase sigma-70 factor (ECF subfamily) [Shimia abyssi]
MDEEHVRLLKRVAERDRLAFAKLYRCFEKPLFRFVQSKLSDPIEAYDIHHDTFLEIWRSARRFSGKSKVKTWVFGIAYHKIIDRHRRAKWLEYPGELPVQIDVSNDAEKIVSSIQESDHLHFCLKQLSPEHSMAISLAFFEDMSYAEISDITDVPQGTIKSRVFHAKKELLECLKPFLGRARNG